MKVTAEVKVVETTKSEGYSSRDYDVEWFTVSVEGHSTSEVEKKITKLQEAATHLGMKLQ